MEGEIHQDNDIESKEDIDENDHEVSDNELNEEEDYNHVDSKKAEDGKFKYGIIYLSYIPEGLNVKLLHEMMSQFGAVGRIYLEPVENNKKRRTYIEGWIEFKKKRVAKAVAKKLNGTALQYGRKHCKMNGQIWSIKYLHRFKWAHLTEQLAHDRAVRDQKRRFEMGQTKKQVDFYQKMTEQSKRNRKIKSDQLNEAATNKIKSIVSKQNRPIKTGEEMSVPVDEDLLNSIFKKVS